MKDAFPALIAPTARILILGTMPGEESLRRGEYYANPPNQFWRIMQELYNIPMNGSYTERVAGLRLNLIGLWDVLQSCERTGSLDSAIRNAVPNDFNALFAENPGLQVITFNGKKPAEWFEKWVSVEPSALRKLALPSTSPAAAMAFEKKVAAWAVLHSF